MQLISRLRGHDIKWDANDDPKADTEIAADDVFEIDIEDEQNANDLSVAHSKMLFTSGFTRFSAGALGNIAYLKQVPDAHEYHPAILQRLRLAVTISGGAFDQQKAIQLHRSKSPSSPKYIRGLEIHESLHIVA
jgi:hypothetical protein